MPKCWYCKVERKLGDGHMYKCAHDKVRKDNFNNAMVDALNAELTMDCPIEQCGEVFSGKFSKITIDSIKHFYKYHEDDI